MSHRVSLSLRQASAVRLATSGECSTVAAKARHSLAVGRMDKQPPAFAERPRSRSVACHRLQQQSARPAGASAGLLPRPLLPPAVLPRYMPSPSLRQLGPAPGSNVLLDAKASPPPGSAAGARRRAAEVLAQLRTRVQRLAAAPSFERFILAIICLNTVALAMEHQGQPGAVTSLNSVCLPLFSALFALELMVKLVALGPVLYFIDAFNAFDCLVVIIGVMDAISVTDGLSALRGFRLLRVFTALRFLPTMRKQLGIMAKTLDSVLPFFMLLLIFIFIMTILGMHLFGE